jgi:hypothetical protein
MIEILIILGVVVLIAWAVWNYTDISGRLALAGEHFTLNPLQQEDLDRLNEPTITSMEGVTTTQKPFEIRDRIAPPPPAPKPSLAVPLGTPDLPNRVENPDLGYETISDMPFLHRYPERLAEKHGHYPTI